MKAGGGGAQRFARQCQSAIVGDVTAGALEALVANAGASAGAETVFTGALAAAVGHGEGGLGTVYARPAAPTLAHKREVVLLVTAID